MANDRPPSKMLALQQQLTQREPKFRESLPKGIEAGPFVNTIVVAVSLNPRLLDADRKSLMLSCLQAANDGLLPDGREGALVEFWDTRAKVAMVQWLPMTYGIRKKIYQSGQVKGLICECVYSRDSFSYRLGDSPRIKHRPALGERGEIVAAYSIAELKSGFISREVMDIGEILKIRDRSSAWRGAVAKGKQQFTPWGTSLAEMCRKTVLKRHSKQLPMSRETRHLMDRDEALFNETGKPLPAPAKQLKAETVDDTLDDEFVEGEAKDVTPGMLDGAVEAGRKHEEVRQSYDPDTGEVFPGDTPADMADDIDDPDLAQAKADFELGEIDREAGRKVCSSAELAADPDRLRRWQNGWNAAGASKSHSSQPRST